MVSVVTEPSLSRRLFDFEPNGEAVYAASLLTQAVFGLWLEPNSRATVYAGFLFAVRLVPGICLEPATWRFPF